MKNYNVSKAYIKKVDGIIAQAKTLREGVHNLLIEGLIPAYKDGQNGKLTYLLDNLNGVSGSFRVQAVVHYLETIAGFVVEYSNEDGYKLIRNKENQEYTFDSKHLKTCKEEKYRFWKIAAPEKPLKVCDLNTVFNSAIVQVSRAMAINSLTETEVKDMIQGIFDQVQTNKNSSTTKKWIKKYQEQEGITDTEIELKEAFKQA